MLFRSPGVGIEHARKAPELRQQGLGDGLGIAARDRGEQQVFEHLVIGECLRAAGQQSLPQPRAMPLARRLARIPPGRGVVEKIETVFSFRQCDPRQENPSRPHCLWCPGTQPSLPLKFAP